MVEHQAKRKQYVDIFNLCEKTTAKNQYVASVLSCENYFLESKHLTPTTQRTISGFTVFQVVWK